MLENKKPRPVGRGLVRLANSTLLMARDRQEVDEAYPGDVVGLFDPGIFRIGDTLADKGTFNYEGIPSFSPEHFVKVKVRREPPFMVFDVEDNGIGMDRETREKIFSLFFSSKGIKGTGLGLFIANKIVDRHGGSIEVASEPGRGTRFLVRLPLEARPSTRPPEQPLPETT